jgi:hypothetical protein
VRGRAPAAACLLLLWLGCGGSGGPIPLPPGTGVAPGPQEALGFYSRAEAFYQRLAKRRMNALETFNDAFLREHFKSKNAFFDYYADLAYQLSLAHFEKSRPQQVEVQEFVFETATQAWVQVRFVGGDDRPLRPDSTSLIRLDRWELADGTWWVVPSKL